MKLENVAANKIEYSEPIEFGGHMDILMTNALLESLFTIFSTMVRLKIEPGIPVTKHSKAAKGEVSGLIGMNAESTTGSIALSFTLPVIREISRNLLGQEIASINDEAIDLTGEMTNMLVGGAKRILSERGHDFDMQTPQLLRGDGHEIIHYNLGKTVLLPLKIKQDEFYMELNFI